MYPPTLATPPYAGRCSNCLELTPSRLAAALWYAWLALVCLVTLFGVALPWPVRCAICLGVIVPAVRSVESFVRLAGPRAVRAIEWSEEGEFTIAVGTMWTRHRAIPSAGSFRGGAKWWVLRFVTQSGPRLVLVVETPHDTRAFRRLSRCLDARLFRASGRSSRPAVTMPPKV
jgi:hypothetical protein